MTSMRQVNDVARNAYEVIINNHYISLLGEKEEEKKEGTRVGPVVLVVA